MVSLHYFSVLFFLCARAISLSLSLSISFRILCCLITKPCKAELLVWLVYFVLSRKDAITGDAAPLHPDANIFKCKKSTKRTTSHFAVLLPSRYLPTISFFSHSSPRPSTLDTISFTPHRNSLRYSV